MVENAGGKNRSRIIIEGLFVCKNCDHHMELVIYAEMPERMHEFPVPKRHCPYCGEQEVTIRNYRLCGEEYFELY